MLTVLVGGGETATKTGWESAARDGERRCDDPWTLDPHGGGGHTNTACACNTLQSRTDFNATTNRERRSD